MKLSELAALMKISVDEAASMLRENDVVQINLSERQGNRDAGPSSGRDGMDNSFIRTCEER